MNSIVTVISLIIFCVHHSNEKTFDLPADDWLLDADIDIEDYFNLNDENLLVKIDPNIAEDARLDTVIVSLAFL